MLNAEPTGQAGHEHGGAPVGEGMRAGARTKAMLAGIGPVETGVPRDRDGPVGPVVVPECRLRLDGVDQIVLPLTVRGSTTGGAVRFDEACGAEVSEDTVGRVGEEVVGGLAGWSGGSPGAVRPVVLVDAIRKWTRSEGEGP